MNSQPKTWIDRCAERIDAERIWFRGELPIETIAAIIREYAEPYLSDNEEAK